LHRRARLTSHSASWGGGVLALGFGDDLQRPWNSALRLDNSGWLATRREFRQVIGMTANDVEPRQLFGLVAPIALPNLCCPPAVLIRRPASSWKAHVRKQGAFGWVLKHSAEPLNMAHSIDSKLSL